MRKILLSFTLMFIPLIVSAQVSFKKWEYKQNPFYEQFKILKLQIINVGEKTIKYCIVDYYAVNSVGDAVDGTISVINPEHTKIWKKKVRCTGPYEPGCKSIKLEVSPSVVSPGNMTPIPCNIHLDYMDGTSEDIDITKENFSNFFPNSEWIDYIEPEQE